MGTHIQMTKKILLAAAAVGAMAFAGAASAGTLSNSTIGTVSLNDSGTGALKTYTVASEVTDPVAGTPNASGVVTLRNKLTNPATVNAGATVNYVVKFTLAGNAKFAGTPTLTVYDNAGTPAVITAGVSTQNISPAGGGSVEYLVTFNPATSTTIGAFELGGVTLAVSAEGDINVSSVVEQAAGGSFVTIDTMAATKIVQYKAALAAPAVVTQNVLAGLPDFKAFKQATTNPASLSNPLSGSTTLSRTATASGFSIALNSGTFHRDLLGAAGSTIAAAGDIIDTAIVTVTGTNLDKLSPKVGGVAATAGATATSASFGLATGTLSANFALEEAATAADRVVLQAGNYTGAYLPTYKSGFTSPTTAASLGALLNVTLDGTNFMAPWFTLNNANNTAFLRLANNGSTPTGPVFVELKAHNGTTAPTTARVKVADSIAPNGVFQITGPELAALFGGNAQNGDLQVTIQGDGNVISGKVRVRNATGALSEQSLGNLGN